jgi:F-type H+-transporting ATPase subunit gamma
MKSLAAASIGQYERSVHALADYRRTVEIGLGACLRESEANVGGRAGAGPADSTRVRRGRVEPAEVGAVVFGSDQGLVGQFNDVVAENAAKALASVLPNVRVWAVGERVSSRLKELGLAPSGSFDVPNSVESITPLVGQILVETEAGDDHAEVTELHLFYNRPTPGAGFEPVGERLLPLDEDWRRERAGVPWPTKALPEVPMGGGTATLGALVREYLFVSIFRASAESLASENASRLAAMDRAEKNIDDSLETLQETFHRVRQGKIDEELFDVVSGFEALSKRKNGAARSRVGR